MPGGPGALRLMVLAVAVLMAGCIIEDRTPKGSRRDQTEIQSLIYAYHRGLRADPSGDPNPGDMRIVRVDLRQEGDLAAAWVTARIPSASSEPDVVEHFVLRRDGDTWRVVNVSVARRTPARTRASP